MIELWTDGIRAFFEPGTAASATAEFAGFRYCTTLVAAATYWRNPRHHQGCFCENTVVVMTQNTLT